MLGLALVFYFRTAPSRLRKKRTCQTDVSALCMCDPSSTTAFVLSSPPPRQPPIGRSLLRKKRIRTEETQVASLVIHKARPSRLDNDKVRLCRTNERPVDAERLELEERARRSRRTNSQICRIDVLSPVVPSPKPCRRDRPFVVALSIKTAPIFVPRERASTHPLPLPVDFLPQSDIWHPSPAISPAPSASDQRHHRVGPLRHRVQLYRCSPLPPSPL
ncbi:hypothetical protein FA10DRAFT_60687 [Acaromyces ingoldii]|uniref:Uncharacterized protein n=1 Tax=Acaromyces ingoldii TaxID=215250 RepID=A0A316YQQ3_9BASI|nr:hypothetical protein FA10DRAFT_60687 [Acaromyces ingoldii]PWN91144.1 hypothetical protein FA10DRAFT_60687 [Acaromyces ingoldii]